MKLFPKSFFLLWLLPVYVVQAQHASHFIVHVDVKSHTMDVVQELTFFNQSQDSIGTIVLNDWNNAYSDKNSWLGRRFSDEFVRSFHLANEGERGRTSNLVITGDDHSGLNWLRPKGNIDLVEVSLKEKLAPGGKVLLHLTYSVKIPNDKFTKWGYNDKGEMNLKDWFLTPARYENHHFTSYSNVDLDDITNGISDFDLEVAVPAGFDVDSDLDELQKNKSETGTQYTFSGKKRNDLSLFIRPKPSFEIYRNDLVEVDTDLKDNKLTDIQKAIVVDRIVHFVHDEIGQYPYKKITVSQIDYDRNPFYGLNQLPAFLSPFSDEFLFELKFLKTYLNNYLHSSMHLDSREDNWIYDAIQMYAMMDYMDAQHPDAKMMGSLSKFKLLKSYHIINLGFNEQYSYYYMLMARKNLDQPLGDSKDKLIRFNEKIASKYHAGLSLKYLNDYLGDSIVPKNIKAFYSQNKLRESSRADFENQFRQHTTKNIDWFFKTIIDSREIIDYTFGNVNKTKDSVTFTVKNRTGATVPIPVFGISKKQVVFKKWLENVKADSTFTFDRKNADKIVLNYKDEVPEFNQRNNWKSLNTINNRRFKFVFLKDLEDPDYNQILYIPTVIYNLYDGLSPGLRFNGKTLLDKTFNFDVNPVYSPNTQTLTGSMNFNVNQYIRDSRFFNVRYGISGSYFHYAPDAAYLKINPSLSVAIRDNDFRDNRKQGFLVRYNIVQKEHSNIVKDNTDDNYSIFNIRYSNSKAELTNVVGFNTDLQLSSPFGKVSGEMQYRKLFDNNRQINLRFYAGTFLYHSNLASDTYDFGVSSPNDYLFEYNFFGRSETSGLFSQQYFQAEGGFKSFLNPAKANQWLSSLSASFNVWNWIELYGDTGFAKNKGHNAVFLYDSGVRLNLVPDYFELYFPVYSNNGWEIAQRNYNERIRFIVTFSPKTLFNLFTRKWF